MANSLYKTPSGIYVDLVNPQEDRIKLSDIAWNLASICRYGGSTLGHYSVAQHCVFMDTLFLLRSFNDLDAIWTDGLDTIWSEQIKDIVKESENNAALCKRIRMEILLHDASEAYLGDIPSPLKQLLPEYKAIEKQWMKAIRSAFNLPPNINNDPQGQAINLLVKSLDDLSLQIERRWVQVADAEKYPVGAWNEQNEAMQTMAEQWIPIVDKSFWSREVARKVFESRYNLIEKIKN